MKPHKNYRTAGRVANHFATKIEATVLMLSRKFGELLAVEDLITVIKLTALKEELHLLSPDRLKYMNWIKLSLFT